MNSGPSAWCVLEALPLGTGAIRIRWLSRLPIGAPVNAAVLLPRLCVAGATYTFVARPRLVISWPFVYRDGAGPARLPLPTSVWGSSLSFSTLAWPLLSDWALE